ncbi:MAG: PEP/pyruvate-binding domain-containing protein [Parcubacteria group bacterium]|jgi:phosphoenolpyruvate synthase/pyruvate phosphate dikinase
MELIRAIKKITTKDTSIAGGKGASLGEMTQANIPVPDGFVILSDAFEIFLEETGLNTKIDSILHSVNFREIHSVESASKKIKSLIISKDIPGDIEQDIKIFFKKLNTKFVAVRSSATAEDSASAAWAGQLESYLNTTKNNLLENIKKCWASLFTPRAIFYRFEKRLHKQKISVAVVVQKMIDSDISGIAFSVHPVTQDKNQLIIEAGFGLGEATVSGQITPDSYVVVKKPLKITNIKVNEQTRGIYRSKEGGNEWKEILKAKGGSQALSDNQIKRLSEIILSIEKHYNFPCDVEWALEKNKFYIMQSRPITTLGNRKEHLEANPIDFKNRKWAIYGTSAWPAYITPFAIVPSKKFGKVYGISNDVVAIWKGKSLDWLFDETQLVEFAQIMLPKIIKNKWDLYDSWQAKVKRFDKLHYQLLHTNLSHISNKEFHDWIEKYYEYFVEQYTANDFIEPLSLYFQNHLQGLLSSEGIENGKAKKLMDLYSNPSKPNYIQQCIEEYKKAKSEKDVTAVLKKFHYINNDYTGSHTVTKRDLKKLVARSPHFSVQINSSKRLPSKITNLLTVLQMTATIQDIRKAESLMWVSGAEKLLRELSKRQNIPMKELLLATWNEIIDNKYDRSELMRRRKHCIIYWQLNDTKIWSGHKANQITSDFKRSVIGDTKNMQEFKGVSASGGKVKGRAAVVLDRNQFRKVKKGDILIAVATRPEYMPVMRLAAAFVTDEGGITSHAAIVAREMKKPCVIATKMASKIIKDGNLLEVDADNGIVKILKNKKEVSSESDR